LSTFKKLYNLYPLVRRPWGSASIFDQKDP
jgi:hypothetical protein